MFGFLKDGFSIDEMKVSSLVLCLFIVTGYTLFAHHYYGDISDNLLSVLQALILAVGGVNIANSIATAVKPTVQTVEVADPPLTYAAATDEK